MSGRPLDPVLPLPRQWSRRVRAAVIHAISLAQFATTAEVAAGLAVCSTAGSYSRPVRSALRPEHHLPGRAQTSPHR